MADKAKLVTTQHVSLPFRDCVFLNAVISPGRNSIAWRLRRGSAVEIWMSDSDGKHMVQVGKLLQPETSIPGDLLDVSELEWILSGKGISFREAGEFYVVYRDVRVRPR